MAGEFTKKRFHSIIEGLPPIVQDQILEYALIDCNYMDILSYFRAVDLLEIKSNPASLQKVKAVSKCISSISIGDKLGLTLKGFPNFTEYTPSDSIYQLIIELISTNEIYFEHLQLEVSDDVMLPNILKLCNSFTGISIDDFSGHSLIESYEDIELINKFVLSKVKSIKTTFLYATQLINAFKLERLPSLKRIIFYINDFHDLKIFYNDKMLIKSLMETFDSKDSPVFELSYPNLCNQYNELGMVSLISKIHQLLPKVEITSCASVNIPSDSKDNYWSLVNNVDPRFLVLGGGVLNSYEQDYYIERVKDFKNINLYGTEAHDISFVTKLLHIRPTYFSKLKSLCLILDEFSSLELNNLIPKSMDTLTLDVKNFKVLGQWTPPQELSELKIGIHDSNEVPILQSCNWTGCKLGTLQMYLKRDNPFNTNKEFDIATVPSSINMISIMGDCEPNTKWVLKVRNLPNTWDSSTKVRYSPKRALESAMIIGDDGCSITTVEG